MQCELANLHWSYLAEATFQTSVSPLLQPHDPCWVWEIEHFEIQFLEHQAVPFFSSFASLWFHKNELYGCGLKMWDQLMFKKLGSSKIYISKYILKEIILGAFSRLAQYSKSHQKCKCGFHRIAHKSKQPYFHNKYPDQM